MNPIRACGGPRACSVAANEHVKQKCTAARFGWPLYRQLGQRGRPSASVVVVAE
jgi:hypothetical protein